MLYQKTLRVRCLVRALGKWNIGEGVLGGTGTILSTLLRGRYYHAHCKDKVMETWND